MGGPNIANFHALWRELHLRPYSIAKIDIATEQAFLHRLGHRTRCNGCFRHWREAMDAAGAPAFNSRPAYFRWTVKAHNEINRRLVKRIFSQRDARKVWGAQAAGLLFSAARRKGIEKKSS